MSSLVYKENALDLIRLLAALQVAVLHTVEILGLEVANSPMVQALEYFPGVPIFFFVSGYLISRSFENAPGLKTYFSNRFLRIFPGLWVCVIFNILLVATTGYFVLKETGFGEIVVLAIAKSTILQFYNPEFMRDFGDGVLNGSLWTITVELQFYVIVPLMYMLFLNRFRRVTFIVLVAILIFLFCNRFLYMSYADYHETVLWKLYRVSFVPWFYMFLFGVLLQRNFELVSKVLIRLPFWLHGGAFAMVCWIAHENRWVSGNDINPLFFFFLAGFVLKICYTNVFVNVAKVLKGNDLSYGVYIFHMPILNQFIYLKYQAGALELTLLFMSYVLIALASWFLIEKPSLKLKKYSVRS